MSDITYNLMLGLNKKFDSPKLMHKYCKAKFN